MLVWGSVPVSPAHGRPGGPLASIASRLRQTAVGVPGEDGQVAAGAEVEVPSVRAKGQREAEPRPGEARGRAAPGMGERRSGDAARPAPEPRQDAAAAITPEDEQGRALVEAAQDVHVPTVADD